MRKCIQWHRVAQIHPHTNKHSIKSQSLGILAGIERMRQVRISEWMNEWSRRAFGDRGSRKNVQHENQLTHFLLKGDFLQNFQMWRLFVLFIWAHTELLRHFSSPPQKYSFLFLSGRPDSPDSRQITRVRRYTCITVYHLNSGIQYCDVRYH